MQTFSLIAKSLGTKLAPPGVRNSKMSLFKNPILEVASTYGATVKNFTLGFSPKIFLGVTIHVGGSGKNFGAKSP